MLLSWTGSGERGRNCGYSLPLVPSCSCGRPSATASDTDSIPSGYVWDPQGVMHGLTRVGDDGGEKEAPGEVFFFELVFGGTVFFDYAFFSTWG